MDINRFHELNIILLCGLYGSGKTEFAVKFFKGKNRSRISRTEIRKQMFEMTHYGEQWSSENFTEEYDTLVKHIERKTLEHLLFNKQKVLIVNTFLTRKSRKWFIEMAKGMKKTIGAIFLERPLEQCLSRNEHNSLVVPREVVTRLFYKIELPEKSEGFDEALTVTFKSA
jgi:predicted kinase